MATRKALVAIKALAMKKKKKKKKTTTMMIGDVVDSGGRSRSRESQRQTREMKRQKAQRD